MSLDIFKEVMTFLFLNFGIDKMSESTFFEAV